MRSLYTPYALNVSDFASGPPSSPSSGDIWIATVDANGTRWQFQYNAGSASAYKWEFIGGSPVLLQDTSGSKFVNTLSATWQQIYTGTIATAREGDYFVTTLGEANMQNTSGVREQAMTVGYTTPTNNYGIILWEDTLTINIVMTGMAVARWNSVPANSTWKYYQYMQNNTAGASGVYFPGMSVVPIRVA